MLDPHAELLRINARIKEILLQHMPRTGTYHSPVPGLVTRRLETCHTTTTCLGKPSASIIVQGEKIAMLGGPGDPLRGGPVPGHGRRHAQRLPRPPGLP